MSIDQRIGLLRAEMNTKQIDAYIVSSSDPHQSEYVADIWKSREWISGFTGSAGLAIITKTHAGVWTDSRYFIQAETELADSEMVLHKVYNQFSPQHLDWLSDHLAPNSTVGVDGACFSIKQFESIEKKLQKKGISLQDIGDLFATVWENRPSLPSTEAFIHHKDFQGQTIEERVALVKQGLQIGEHALYTALDDIAWLYHLRGRDVECNPVVIAYTLINANQATLYIDLRKVTPSLKVTYEQANVKLKDYQEFKKDIAAIGLDDTVYTDFGITNYDCFTKIQSKLEHRDSDVRQYKAIKSEKEVGHIEQCMIRDGVALTKSFIWLEKQLESREVSEYDFAMKIAKFRSEQDHYFGESFNAIVGYNGNGAIIHYRPMADQSAHIKNEGVLLCDSGGQYYDGTTDITRTVCLGNDIDPEFALNYTMVLKGMIDLDMVIYPEGTTGGQLDVLARQHIWSLGRNYLHGTGHGVGYFLNVHEPPQGFTAGASSRGNTKLKEGMITSNEPGYYKDHHYGIRIENIIVTEKAESEGFLKNRSLTLFPIDTRPILVEKLSIAEKDWLNSYHSKVNSALSPYLDAEETDWLAAKCASI